MNVRKSCIGFRVYGKNRRLCSSDISTQRIFVHAKVYYFFQKALIAYIGNLKVGDAQDATVKRSRVCLTFFSLYNIRIF